MAGVDLPESKKTVYALTRIAGIGITSARALCKCANIEEHVKFRDLTTQQFRTIVTLIADNFLVEGDLRRKTATRIKRLMDIGCYRGLRHRKSLPTRGQRTHTNARTRKGKPTPIAGKKK
ncbi:30S ribosomal protein S13 [Thalassospira sp. UBA4513]|uniref:30S ribosomal protein S13 n=1 Tax=Thalassospira sp. UBA4513 TaxID=1947675 RepID=UPI00257E92A6|nr:30S ribosomal protein S13 [Thalassospira sp. UBA4513]